MTAESQRDTSVRPNRAHQEIYISPIQEEVGDLEEEPNIEDEVVVEEKVIDTDTRPVLGKDVRLEWIKCTTGMADGTRTSG